MVTRPDQALALLHEQHYSAIPVAELRDEFNAQKMFLSREWRDMYQNGTVVNWLQQVTNFYLSFAAMPTSVPGRAIFRPVYLSRYDWCVITTAINQQWIVSGEPMQLETAVSMNRLLHNVCSSLE
jgi:hypothetical protein